MEEIIHVPAEQSETGNLTEYTESVVECFDSVPEVAKPLIGSAGRLLNRIEKMLYSAPAFVGAVKAVIPEEAYQVILTDEQKAKIASGALKLMTKKDGSLMANLINPETKKIVSTVSLGKVKLSPELSQAMTNYATQMQMAQIAEQIQFVQVAVEEVRQGQEYDRLATAYSCQQKLIQASAIQNPRLKEMALMQLVSDAENSRNLLMQSQSANAAFIGSKGYEHKAKLTILKEAARTLNYLTENNLLQYADLEKKAEDIHSSYARTGDELKSVEARLREVQPLIKNISNYQRLKPVYDAYMKAADKPAFRSKHEAEFVIYEAARSTLLAMQGDGKLPSLKSLQAEQQQLMEAQQRLYGERAKLKKEARLIDTMKANVDDFLSPSLAKEHEKSRSGELE